MILLQQSSGLTVKEWCRDYGINDRTFYCRMKIVRKEELQRQSGGLIDTTNAYENKSNFQKLSFPSQNMPSPSITMSVSDVTLNSPITEAERGLDYCNKLFQLERELVDLTPQRRYEKRLELERPVWDAFWKWIDRLDVLPNSGLEKAVAYAKNQKPYLEKYLKDGRCSISNNLAENAIRPFTVGRKNWLFSVTPKGAKSSADCYSLIETAKANNLHPYKYLQYVLQFMSFEDWKNDESLLNQIMPWADNVIKYCAE